MIEAMLSTRPKHAFETDDVRLRPIHAKVLAGQRLDESDALALYRSPDILAVGWPAKFGARADARRQNVFQCQSPHQSDQCLRGRLPPLRFRPEERRSRLLYDGAR